MASVGRFSARWIDGWRIKCWVVLQGTELNWVPVSSGIPQVSVLGPLLFIIYINNIHEGIKGPGSWNVQTMLRSTQMRVEASRLQDDLGSQRLADALQCGQVQLFIHIEHGNMVHGARVFAWWWEVSYTPSWEVAVSSSHGPWCPQCVETVKKSNRALGMIWRTFAYLSPKLVGIEVVCVTRSATPGFLC